MAERSEAVEERAVRDVSAAYSVEAGITTSEDLPPGYKRTEVGVIPEDWIITSLGELAVLYQPVTISGRDLKDQGYPVYGANGLIGCFHKFNHESWQTTITCRGSTCGTVSRSQDKSWITGNTMVANCDGADSIDKVFFYYLLLNQDFTVCITGTGQPQIVRTPLASFKLGYPASLEEQHAIATALSDADALIESLDRLIAKKRAIKQAAMQQLLTGQNRLPGFSGEWETRRLEDHVSFLKTGTNSRAELTSNGRIAYLHYGDIHVRASVTLNPNAVTMPHIAASKVRHLDKLAPGDLVFVDASEDLEGVGKSVEIIDVPKEGMVAGLHTIAARFDKDVLTDGFKAYLQFCPQFIGTLRRLAAGTKVLATNRQHVASVEMKLPCVAEQQAVATVLSDMDTEIEALERRRDKARQIKQGMMQQLLTGRVRLVAPQTTESVEC